jgi:hypothetical protein
MGGSRATDPPATNPTEGVLCRSGRMGKDRGSRATVHVKLAAARGGERERESERDMCLPEGRARGGGQSSIHRPPELASAGVSGADPVLAVVGAWRTVLVLRGRWSCGEEQRHEREKR